MATSSQADCSKPLQDVRSVAKREKVKKVSTQFKAESMGESEQHGGKTGDNSPVWVVQVLCDDRDPIKRD